MSKSKKAILSRIETSVKMVQLYSGKELTDRISIELLSEIENIWHYANEAFVRGYISKDLHEEYKAYVNHVYECIHDRRREKCLAFIY